MIKKRVKTERLPAKHGVYLWLREGRIHPSVRGYKRLKRYLRDLERGLFELQGGAAEVTPAKEILIKSTIEAYGVVLLASIFCKGHGVVRPDRLQEGVVELQPVLGHQFLAFMNTIRQNLIVLGMDKRKANEILDLGKYIEMKDKGKAQGKDKVAPEIVDPRASQSEIQGD